MKTTKEQRNEVRASLRSSVMSDEGSRIISSLCDEADAAERYREALEHIATAGLIHGLYHGGETYSGLARRLKSIATEALKEIAIEMAQPTLVAQEWSTRSFVQALIAGLQELWRSSPCGQCVLRTLWGAKIVDEDSLAGVSCRPLFYLHQGRISDGSGDAGGWPSARSHHPQERGRGHQCPARRRHSTLQGGPNQRP